MTTAWTAVLAGITARVVTVDVTPTSGPSITIEGIPEAAVTETRVRVRSALAQIAHGDSRDTYAVKVGPGPWPIRGASLDLAIACAIAATTRPEITGALSYTLLLGELSLNGDLRPIRGAYAALLAPGRFQTAIVPFACADEVLPLTDTLDVRVARNLREVLDHLAGECSLPRLSRIPEHERPFGAFERGEPDLADVNAQDAARRALEIAAAGRHNLLIVGPPGACATMLTRRLPGILPPPDAATVQGIRQIASAAGLGAAERRPFRAPHHTASVVAIVGGGTPIRPGEVTLAHGGVLYLDQLPEFQRSTLAALTSTLTAGKSTVARAGERVTMPAAPLLVAYMHGCPCGYVDAVERSCTCSDQRIATYLARIDQATRDLFPLNVKVQPVNMRDVGKAPGESSAAVWARVNAAQRNAADTARREASYPAWTTAAAKDLLARATNAHKHALETKQAQRNVIHVARTIADLSASERVEPEHMFEALNLSTAVVFRTT